jgi:hypothetical protein
MLHAATPGDLSGSPCAWPSSPQISGWRRHSCPASTATQQHQTHSLAGVARWVCTSHSDVATGWLYVICVWYAQATSICPLAHVIDQTCQQEGLWQRQGLSGL